jgi:hypothetical protein
LSAIAVLLALPSVRLLEAQRAASLEVRTQEHLVDTLVARWRNAYRALKSFDDSVARLRAVTDTLRVGSLRLLVEPALRVRVEAAARLASARIDSLAGSGAKRLESRWLAVHFANDSSRDSIVVATRLGDNSEEMHIWGVVSDSAIAQWIYADALRLLSFGIDRPFHDWLASELSPDTLATVAWLATRLDVVSSDAFVARRCYDGDLAACRIAFRLVDVADPVTGWYDAPGRQRHVKLVASRQFSGREGQNEAEDCAAGTDAACIAFMRKWPAMEDPIPSYRRRSLASVAMHMGGRSGFERMLTSTGTPAERLAAAAGAPVDSVLRVWLAKVRDTRLPSQDMTPGIAASSLGWILVCGLLALRSTRWR